MSAPEYCPMCKACVEPDMIEYADNSGTLFAHLTCSSCGGKWTETYVFESYEITEDTTG